MTTRARNQTSVARIQASTPLGNNPQGICVAWHNNALDDPVAWTRLDNYPGINIQSVSVQRGRTDERSKTDPGSVTIRGVDTAGVLDPTNPSGPFYGQISPCRQAAVTLFNPTDNSWNYIYRGYIDTLTYNLSENEDWVDFEIDLVDSLDILNDAEVVPDNAGNTVPGESVGDCFYTGQHVDDRLFAVLADASTVLVGRIWPADKLEIASGNVNVQGRIYSNRTSMLQVIDEACDAEYPGGTNRFITTDGSFAFRGRYYRFVPEFYIPHGNRNRVDGARMLHWFLGDANAYSADNETAVMQTMKFSMSKTNLINMALITPVGATDSQIADPSQFYHDSASIRSYGPRTSGASLENLITSDDNGDGLGDLSETATFGDVTVQNYKDPVCAVSEATFTNPAVGDAWAGNTWRLLCGVELSDLVTCHTTHPGGGGFQGGSGFDLDHFVESIKYDIEPLQGDIWQVVLTLGLSSRHHFRYLSPLWNAPSEGGPSLTADFAFIVGSDGSVSFFDESSPGPSGPITDWFWDFGDGNSVDGTNTQPVHDFATGNTYTVTLTVTGSGADGTASQSYPVIV